MGVITGYSRRTANIGSGGGGSVATTLYNSDDTISNIIRVVSLYGNTLSDKLIFENNAGNDILTLYGNKIANFGDGSTYIKLDPYGSTSWGILQFCSSGTTYAYNVYDSGLNERFRVETSGLVYARRGSISSFLNYTSSINFWAEGSNGSFHFVGTNGSNHTLYLGNNSGHGYAEIKNSSGVTKSRISGSGDSYFINSLAIGVSTAHSSAFLDIQTTTKGLGLPTMTTAEKNAIALPRTGLCVFDTTLGAISAYNGAAWV